MVNAHEHQNTGYYLWSLFSTGPRGQEIHELFQKKVEKKKQRVGFFIFNFKYEMCYLKVIHIHEA